MIRITTIGNVTAGLRIGLITLYLVNPRNFYTVLAGVLALLTVACGPAATPETTLAPYTPPSSATTLPPTGAPTSAGQSQDEPTELTSESAFPSPLLTGKSNPSEIVTVEILDETVARYLVREQLASLDFPSDAVGETSDVIGRIIFNPDGAINSDASKISVDLRSLKSDKNRRDRFLRTRSLESDVFPTAEFVVKELPGLAWPIPTEGEASFRIVGDMTVHGFTRPITWEVRAQFSEDSFSGIAKTSFTFDDFDIDVPKVRLVLSVEERMRFELDFQASITSE